MSVRRSALLASLLALACKERGTVSVLLSESDDPDCRVTARTAHSVRAYLVEDTDCCACDGTCLAACAAGDDAGVDCTVSDCGGAFCPIDDLSGGLEISPPHPGRYAAVFHLIAGGDGGPFYLVAGACAQVEVQADGTSNTEVVAALQCCPVPEVTLP